MRRNDNDMNEKNRKITNEKDIINTELLKP